MPSDSFLVLAIYSVFSLGMEKYSILPNNRSFYFWLKMQVQKEIDILFALCNLNLQESGYFSLVNCPPTLLLGPT